MPSFTCLSKNGENPSRRPVWPQRRFCIEPLEERAMLTLIGQSLFPADNPWNQRIDQSPVAANSGTIMNAILGTYGDGRLHPDFGQDYRDSSPLYGIPYNVVHGNITAKIHVIIDAYSDESDLQDVPIPSGAVIEGDLQDGPLNGVDARGDSHLIVWDADNNVAYEFYRASRPGENSDGKWHADGEAVWDMKTNAFRTLGWTSADAAGLAILPGLVRPDEGLPVSQGGQGAINHAIRFTLRNAVILNQFIYPASHVANPGNTNPSTQPPMGARFRLKAGVDISSLNPQSRIIAQAMKSYGLLVADNGSNFFFSGASYAVDAGNSNVLTWNDNDIQDSTHGLKSLHYSDFEVVDLTPVVSGLSATSGAAGAQVTVIGKNFSGAAGHLQVLFGNSAAPSVSVLDDSHVLATVPAGSGTVHVRVQSGVSDPNDAQNIKSPIFGYGASAISVAAPVDWTYGVAKADQTILFQPIAEHYFHAAPFSISAAASSGLSVSFSIVSGPATLAGNMVTTTGFGTVLVRADQAGNPNYNSAPSVTQTFNVVPRPGDGNLDGSVDGSDIVLWAANFTGALGTHPADPKTWAQGDWNDDDSVDGNDVAIWAQNFTGALAGSGLVAVRTAATSATSVSPFRLHRARAKLRTKP